MVICDYDVPEYGIRHRMIGRSEQRRGHGGDRMRNEITFLRAAFK